MLDRRRLGAVVFLLVSSWPLGAAAQALIMPGAGPVNRAMAGASTAAPIDAAGAGYWNPAAISGLPDNEVYFGAELIYADLRTETDLLPPVGDIRSDTGVAAIPTIALVYHRENSPMTVGLGVYGLVGGAVNFPSERTVDPLGFLTNQQATASGLLLAPMVSMQLTPTLAVGAGPMIDMMLLSLDPAFFAPNGPPGDFPSATHGRPTWGGGFQAGVYWEPNCRWSFGVSYKSPQWFEEFEWQALDAAGAPQEISLDLTLPWVLSWGIAYRGIPNTLVALDVRYFDWAGTKTFGQSVADGGTGWESIFSVALGIERKLNQKCKLRVGYLYNENPVQDVLTLFNTQLPAINQHAFSLGFSMQMTRAITMDFAWVHSFRNSIRGPIPAAQIPGGATIELTQSLDSWIFGMGVKF